MLNKKSLILLILTLFISVIISPEDRKSRYGLVSTFATITPLFISPVLKISLLFSVIEITEIPGQYNDCLSVSILFFRS